ncbi:PREDICTED: probable BOI-related E3 ubiquitin-protein ligase 3 [Tarenaya hassleriana]|uniref:probable BOI-related E3 ubiquitin-protein ligase 3 n=1 Tax=Tarenaya hassleriana TaxID=28532 RepID=UPI00053C9F0F|nr:PREDICTED: probable BOI-related E3 ubiquitin-protein ligase 3 [Tarenaya hassleriana]
MAVDAHRLSPILSSQFLPTREILNPPETYDPIYGTQMRYSTVPLLRSTSATGETAPSNPMCNIAATTTIPAPNYLIPHALKPVIQSVTFNDGSKSNGEHILPVPSSVRKRPREDSVIVNPPRSSYLQRQKPCSHPIMFLGHDMSLNVQQQQLDVDRLISHHMERMRMEMEEKRKRQGRRMTEAIENGLMRKLKVKDEEIEKMGKMNAFLEEKVRSLCIENQIWRELAESNEATANALRANLQEVLNAVERREGDEQSSCGSGGGVEEKKACRCCGEGEASVLLLPCRHMCLCALCASSLTTCPICHSSKNATLHVNFSSS